MLYARGVTTVHIVGAGIAGLTLAATVQRPDWEIVLHEQGRRRDEIEVGTAFGLWPAAMTALGQIGLADKIRMSGIHASRASIRDARNRLLTSLPEQDVVMIGRTALQRVLFAALPDGVQWRNARVTTVQGLAGEVIVGADGVHSVVRRDRWGERSSARSRSATIIRGVVDGDLSRGEATEYWGNGQLFGITPVSENSTNWFTAFPERRFENTSDGLLHLGRTARGFPAQVQKTIAAARPEQTLINGVHVSRGLLSTVRGSAVLIGDAAHAMTPNLGRGACESIVDAVRLGVLLNRYSPAEALRRYRHQRLISPQAIRIASGALMSLALSNGRQARYRNRVMRAIGRT